MILTKKALKAIENTTNLRLRLAIALGVSERTVLNRADLNKNNNELTTIAAIAIIKEETGYNQKEILTEN